MTIYIKNMVCSRCKMVVKLEFEKLKIKTISLELGQVEVEENISFSNKTKLANNLQLLGFEIIDSKIDKTIDKIKTLIIKLVYGDKEIIKTNLSFLITSQINQDYNFLSNLFSNTEGKTIESYYINLKIERVKEFLDTNEYTLSEIAFKMNYSSVGYLSNQFKKVTGFTPTEFKKIKGNKRIQIDVL